MTCQTFFDIMGRWRLSSAKPISVLARLSSPMLLLAFFLAQLELLLLFDLAALAGVGLALPSGRLALFRYSLLRLGGRALPLELTGRFALAALWV